MAGPGFGVDDPFDLVAAVAENLICRADEFLHRKGRLDHRGHDAGGAEFFAAVQIGHRLAAADLDVKLHVGAENDLIEHHKLVVPAALRLKLRLYGNNVVLVPHLFEQIKHFQFSFIHFSSLQ